MKYLVMILLAFLASPAAAQVPPQTQQKILEVKADEKKAIDAVVKIVNQPVTHMKMNYTPGMVSVYSPGWFHPGAEKPDFNNADVRQTQDLNYARHAFVTSDLNPGEMFMGREIEFNAQLKYFYVDRSVPKKKLTEQEMLEINRLYRQIGADETKLDELENAPMSVAEASNVISTHPAMTILCVVALATLIIMFRTKTSV